MVDVFLARHNIAVCGGVVQRRQFTAAGCQGRVAVISHDETKTTLEMLKKGVLNATIGQEAARQGSEPLQILYDYLTGGSVPEREMIYTRLDICIRENM